MAPKATAPPYSKDEKVLCFHHEMLYEAKILEVQQGDDAMYQYKIHYKGWKNTWDDWVPQDRIRKFNDENRELASQLMQQARASLQKTTKPTKKAALKNGSDFSSARGSEERTSAAAVSGRGPRRARDYDMEHVSTVLLLFLLCSRTVVIMPFLLSIVLQLLEWSLNMEVERIFWAGIGSMSRNVAALAGHCGRRGHHHHVRST